MGGIIFSPLLRYTKEAKKTTMPYEDVLASLDCKKPFIRVYLLVCLFYWNFYGTNSVLILLLALRLDAWWLPHVIQNTNISYSYKIM